MLPFAVVPKLTAVVIKWKSPTRMLVENPSQRPPGVASIILLEYEMVYLLTVVLGLILSMGVEVLGTRFVGTVMLKVRVTAEITP